LLYYISHISTIIFNCQTKGYIKIMYELKIKEIRTQKNITQKEIADALGMTYQQYQKIENSVNIPGLDKIVKIALYLNVRLDDIVKYPIFNKKL